MPDDGGPCLLGNPSGFVFGAIVDNDYPCGVALSGEDDTPDGLLLVECRNRGQKAYRFGLRSDTLAGRRAVVNDRQEIPPYLGEAQFPV